MKGHVRTRRVRQVALTDRPTRSGLLVQFSRGQSNDALSERGNSDSWATCGEVVEAR